MSQPSDYAIVRVRDDRYGIERLTPPGTGTASFIDRVHDRTGGLLGWRLKPLVVMQGARSRIWLSVAEAVASTKLMTLREAETAVAAEDKPDAAGAPQGAIDNLVHQQARPSLHKGTAS
jgi:hypothetical protein